MLISLNIANENLPDWVCWVAQDADGAWWGYQVEPNLSHRSWYENEVGDSIRLKKTKPNDQWQSSLRRIE